MSRVLTFSVSVVSADPAKKASFESALEALAIGSGYAVPSANVYTYAQHYADSISDRTTVFCDLVDVLNRADIDSVTVATTIGDVVFA